MKICKETLIRDSEHSLVPQSVSGDIFQITNSYLERNFSFVTVDNSVAANWAILGSNGRDDLHQTPALADRAPVETVLRQ